jgi:hypothetical protein
MDSGSPISGYAQNAKRLWSCSGLVDVADSHRRKSLGPPGAPMTFRREVPPFNSNRAVQDIERDAPR